MVSYNFIDHITTTGSSDKPRYVSKVSIKCYIKHLKYRHVFNFWPFICSGSKSGGRTGIWSQSCMNKDCFPHHPNNYWLKAFWISSRLERCSHWRCKNCFMMDGEAIRLVSTLSPGQPVISGFIKYCDPCRRPYFPKAWSPCLWRRRYPEENMAGFITWNNESGTRKDLGQLAFDTGFGDLQWLGCS